MIIWILFIICMVVTCILIATDKDDKRGHQWDGVPESQRENEMSDGEIAASISLYFAIVFLVIGILL